MSVENKSNCQGSCNGIPASFQLGPATISGASLSQSRTEFERLKSLELKNSLFTRSDFLWSPVWDLDGLGSHMKFGAISHFHRTNPSALIAPRLAISCCGRLSAHRFYANAPDNDGESVDTKQVFELQNGCWLYLLKRDMEYATTPLAIAMIDDEAEFGSFAVRHGSAVPVLSNVVGDELVGDFVPGENALLMPSPADDGHSNAILAGFQSQLKALYIGAVVEQIYQTAVSWSVASPAVVDFRTIKNPDPEPCRPQPGWYSIERDTLTIDANKLRAETGATKISYEVEG